MTTSLISTGVQFADSTVQTTAAGAGGSSLEAIASGTLADGSVVVVNSDGTVSVAVGSVSVVFESANTSNIATTYDSTANKIVIAFRDGDNSGFGTAIVGTVSGTSISFGTAVVFESAGTDQISATFDSTNEKVAIFYRDSGNSSRGTAIVGTVSGTSISFGTAVEFGTGNTSFILATFDSTANKIIIAFRDGGNSNFGTAIVGTVSGTSISFGTAVVFESANTGNIATTYDSTNNRVVISYSDAGNSSFGTAIVGTVSGTSISFGTAVIFNSASTGFISATFDSTANKVVIAYQDSGNSNFGTAIVGTVSGTSISFGSAEIFSGVSTNGNTRMASYDTANQKIVIVYQAGSDNVGNRIVGTVSGTSISFNTPIAYTSTIASNNISIYDPDNNNVFIAFQGLSNFGTAIAIPTNSNSVTNLTAENYIGISNGAYADTETATIQIVGSVDDAQSGLTAGQSFFVQPNGTLSNTPASPSVFAGTAVSATKLIVKG